MQRMLRATRRLLVSNANPWEANLFQPTSVFMLPYPDPSQIQDPPTWTRIYTGPDVKKLRDSLPPLQFVSAFEYEQMKGAPTHMEQLGVTKAHWAKWSDLHYKLMDNADKYLVNSQEVDEYTAMDAWNRWNDELDEHLQYFSHMMWRFQCFTEANLEIIPPGALREDLRYTAPNDMHPDQQADIFSYRQQWLPDKYKFSLVADPMREARKNGKTRGEMLTSIDQFEREWLDKAKSDLDREMVRYYADIWRDTVAPTRRITKESIESENDLNKLQDMFEEVFADTGDDRLILIAQRACTIRNDPQGQKLAQWAHGLLCRDPDAANRAVPGFPQAPSAPSSDETRLAQLPCDFCEIKTPEQFQLFMDYNDGKFKRILKTFAPEDKALYQKAWDQFKKAATASQTGPQLRNLWWNALGAASPPGIYGPPLLPVKKDAHGTRFLLRMFGALGATGTFNSTFELDPDYLLDAICLVDFDKLSQADIAAIWAEYPGFGLPLDKLTPEQKQKLTSKAKGVALK